MRFLFDHDVPDDTAYGLAAEGHEIHKLRDLMNPEAQDEDVLGFAAQNNYILITCNRDDFLAAAKEIPHAGLIILIRRPSRLQERVALFRLLDKAGEDGIRNNINFA